MNQDNPTSLWWECPLCKVPIEIKRTNPYRYEDHSLVDEHKKDHQKYGLELNK